MHSGRIIDSSRKAAFAALALALLVFLLFPLSPSALRWPARVLFFGSVAVALVGLGFRIAQSLRKPKLFLFAAAALLLGGALGYGALEFAALLYLRSTPDRNANPYTLTEGQREMIEKLIEGDSSYIAFDSQLGWTIEKNGRSPDGLYVANGIGIRGDREYAREILPGRHRVLCFGDSYTHGNSVGNNETWQFHAESGAEGWEFLNFGVGAFGMTQAYLRYRQFKESFDADFVIIGCMTDDIRRTVNVFYPFRLARLDATTFALAKPWSSLDSVGQLVVHSNPLSTLDDYGRMLESPEKMIRRLSRDDLLFAQPPPTPLAVVVSEKLAHVGFGFFRRTFCGLVNTKPPDTKKSKNAKLSTFHPESPIFEINCRLFEEFYEEIEASGAMPVILWFPSPEDFDRYNERGSKKYQTFLDFFEANGLRYIDSLDWILESSNGKKRLPTETLFIQGHYSSEVNQVIGERLADYLESLSQDDQGR